MSTKSPSLKPKRKRQTKEDSKHESVAPVHKPVKSDIKNLSESPIHTDNGEIEDSAESNKTFIYEDKNDNVQAISRDISIDTGLQINSKIENGIIGFMEAEIKKEKSKYSHFTDSRPQSLSFYEDEKIPEELSGQLEQLSPEEKRVLKRRRDDRKIDIELDASTYKEIQNVLNREKEEVLLAGIMKSQKSKSRKKKQFEHSDENIPGIGDSREHMIPNGKKKSKKSKKRDSSPLPGTSHGKKKHRKREEHEPRNDITVALEDLQDDVFEKDANDVNHYDGQSRMPIKANTVYVQKKNGFQATPRDRLFSSIEINKDEGFDKSFSEMVPLELALIIQKYWLPFTVLCHGLLAGLALTHIIVTQSNIMDEEFINQYKKYSEAYTALFFFLCIICTVSVFDRYDIKHMNFTRLLDIVKERKTAVVIGIYISALLVHLVNAKHDDHINLYNYINENENSTIEMMSVEDLNYWNTLSFWRSLLAIFGWVLVALGSSEDMLRTHLSSMERFIQNPA